MGLSQFLDVVFLIVYDLCFALFTLHIYKVFVSSVFIFLAFHLVLLFLKNYSILSSS